MQFHINTFNFWRKIIILKLFPYLKQRYRIFFSAGMDVGHSFIQIRKSCFFFPKTRKKKQVDFLSFPENFRQTFCFFFCSRKSSLAIHSFDFRTVFFFPAPEKKTAFSFIHSIFLLKCTKTNFSGKKKRYLCLKRILRLNLFFRLIFKGTSIIKLELISWIRFL